MMGLSTQRGTKGGNQTWGETRKSLRSASDIARPSIGPSKTRRTAMPTHMTGAAIMPRLAVPKIIDSGIDWMSDVPVAPRTGAGSRTRKVRELNPFTPQPRLAHTPIRPQRVERLQRTPAPEDVGKKRITARSPANRRRNHRRSLASQHSASKSAALTPGGQAPFSGGGIAQPFPHTPAPPTGKSGELGINKWLEEAGLDHGYDGLLPALALAAGDLATLGAMTDGEIREAVEPLSLKGVKARKFHAAIAMLRREAAAFGARRPLDSAGGASGGVASGGRGGPSLDDRPLEAPLDLATSVTRITMEDMLPPPWPRLGPRPPENAPMRRFMPRTTASETTRLSSEPEQAALALGLTGPSEAAELSDLAELLGGGQKASMRAANPLAAKSAAKAAMSAAAVATEAAAVASEKVVEAAEAQAQRRVAGVAEATPRTRAEADSLALDLQAAMDEASMATSPELSARAKPAAKKAHKATTKTSGGALKATAGPSILVDISNGGEHGAASSARETRSKSSKKAAAALARSPATEKRRGGMKKGVLATAPDKENRGAVADSGKQPAQGTITASRISTRSQGASTPRAILAVR